MRFGFGRLKGAYFSPDAFADGLKAVLPGEQALYCAAQNNPLRDQIVNFYGEKEFARLSQ